MIKAAFFDVDGTLVPYGKSQMSDQVREDLLALQRKGIKIFLATGRGKHDLDSTGMLRDVVFDAYVTMTGMCCYDQSGVYRNVCIEREDLINGFRVLREHPELIAIMECDAGNFFNRIDDSLLEFAEVIHTAIYPQRDPEELIDCNIHQFVALVEEEQQDLFLSVMPNCTFARWHSSAIDIIPKGGGKADGILATLEKHGLRKDEVIAFGDGDNDLTMMELAGIGVAMGNGTDRLKAEADYVTASVEEDGVSVALRHFGLL